MFNSHVHGPQALMGGRDGGVGDGLNKCVVQTQPRTFQPQHLPNLVLFLHEKFAPFEKDPYVRRPFRWGSYMRTGQSTAEIPLASCSLLI